MDVKFNASDKFSKKRIYQTRNIISKDTNAIFLLLFVSAIEEVQKHSKIEQILKTTEADILKHYFLPNIENKKTIYRALSVLVYSDKQQQLEIKRATDATASILC